MLAIALAAPTLGAIILNSFKPIVAQRYFGMAAVEVAALLALALAPLAAQRAGALILVAANGIVFSLSFGVLEAIKQNYDDGAAIIAGIVRACPTTTVHTGDRKLDYRDALAFDYLSRRHHFAITPRPPKSPPPARPCTGPRA